MAQLQAQVSMNNFSKEENDDVPSNNENKESSQVEYKEQCESSDNESGEYAVISPANMWTRPDIKIFKQEVSAGKGDGVIRVGHGETVTVKSCHFL